MSTPTAPFVGQHAVVRTYSAGVHLGTVESIDGKVVTLKNARRLWYWKGAFSLNEVATKGISASQSKVATPVENILLTEAIEIIPTTEDARKTFDAAPAYEP